MKFRTTLVFSGLVGALCVSCVDSSCEDTNSCAPASGGSAGAAGGGAGGAAGSSGAAGGGSGGVGGSAGSGATGGSAGSAAAGGSGGTGGDASACDPTALPADDACVVDEEYAVFVSPSGDDNAAGSRAAPLGTVGKGVTAAIAAGKRLYVCADGGSYDESLSLSAASAGLQAFGGFRCSDWTYDPTLRAKVVPSAPGVALSADGVNQPTRLDGFEFEAQSAAQPGGSSVAAFVKTSSGVQLFNVALRAGDGAAGASGGRAQWTLPSIAALKGNDASSNTGAAEKVSVCPSGVTTIGGLGGTGGGSPTGGAAGLPALGGGSGGSGTAATCFGTPGGAGGDGENGGDGTAGPGAATLGDLDASGGWQPAPGSAGTVGQDGQGGGGGRGGQPSGGGGGGGAGGCGGDFGAPGLGGGASIALLVVNSSVALTGADLFSGAGGDGGAGQDGQAGNAPGGPGGTQLGTGFGCPGGRGGNGGNGGPGGGGAGGISVGILHLGAAPAVTGGSITVGSAGTAGPGGSGGLAGVAGVAETVRAFVN